MKPKSQDSANPLIREIEKLTEEKQKLLRKIADFDLRQIH
jgi:hypothetical protein